MKSTLLVPFGLKDDRLFEPNQVPNGKACGCVCPACKKPLLAKQNAKTPHFAHSQDDNCARGFETAVHLAVKQIIAEKLEIRLPELVWRNPFPKYNQTIKVYTERTLQLESVELEQWLDNLRPDIVVVANNITYLVEVAATHFVDEEKLRKIVRKGFPAFEIDVSGLKSGFTLAELEEAIFTSNNYRAEWKYHPKLEELNLEAKLKEDQRIADAYEEEQERERRFERYKALAPEKKLQINLKSIGLTRQQMDGLSAFVPWDNSFGVPRVVWQSAVLAYISKTQEEQGWEEYLPCNVNSSDCIDWLEGVFKVEPKVQNGEKIAVWKYFLHLESLGILKRLPHKDFDILIGKKGWASLRGKR